MEYKYKFLVRNIGILSISNFASKVLIFILVPLYTSVLSTEEYGKYDLIRTTVSIILPVLSANIGEAVMRFLLNHKKDRKGVITVGIAHVLICIFIGFVFTLVNLYFNLIKVLKGLEWLVFCYFFVLILESFLGQVAKGMEKVKEIGIAGGISTVCILLFNLLFLLKFKWGLKGFFGAYILAFSLTSIYYFLVLKIWKYFRLDCVRSDTSKEMLKYSMPLVINAIGWTLNSSLDKYTVTFFCGASATGLIAVAYKIPNILDVIKTIFIQAWQISAINEYETRDSKGFYSQMYWFINTGLSLCCAGLIIVTRVMAKILFQNNFYEAWQYVPLLLFSVVINSMAGFLGPILSAQYNSKSMAKSAIGGIITNIVCNIIFVQRWQIQGAVLATVISSLVIYIIRIMAVAELVEKRVKYPAYATWIILLCIAVVEINYQKTGIELFLAVIVIIVNKKIICKVLENVIVIIKKYALYRR